MPDLNKYLVYLLVTPSSSSSSSNSSNTANANNGGSNSDAAHRSSAGVMLKNNLLHSYKSQTQETLEYVKTEIVRGLLDPSHMIRNISGNVITALVTRAGISGWPDILPQLMNMAEASGSATEVTTAEGAMSALAKICEDSAKDLDLNYNGQKPLDYMLPKFLGFMASPSPKVRSLSVACVNQFVSLKSPSLAAHIDGFLNALFNLAANDDFEDTRCNVCAAFVGILAYRADKLAPHLDGVVSFTLHCVKDEDERVAKEGCEFILLLAESEDIDQSLVAAHLSRVVPTILSTMVYSEMDQMLLQNLVEDDEDIEDNAQDIRPNIVKTKDVHKFTKGGATDGGNNNNMNESDNDDYVDDDEDDDEDAEAALSEWNLRKCSAAALDVLATKYPELVLEYSMPSLRDGIVSQDWSIREASILAFGAISNGCLDLVGPHLPELVPFLVRTLKDTVPAVRQITSWTLGRYSSWIAFHSAGGVQHEIYLQPVLEGILECCLDKNKKVQEAACSALATLAYEAGEELLPYLEVIFNQLALCFAKFRAKNLQNLYESLQSILDRLGPAVVSTLDPKLIQIIMPPLLVKWNTTSDEDRYVWPLFECVSSVASAFGPQFAPYATDVYTRGVNIISENLILEQNCQNDITLEEPDKEFVITALEMLDGLVTGLKGELSPLIKQRQPPLAELLLACFEDSLTDVRQSAFGLLGDLGTHNVDVLLPYMPAIMKTSIMHMDMSYGPAVCNNAIWAAGEISLSLGGSGIHPYSNDLFQRLVTVLDSEDVVSTVSENAAIAIGRLGKSVPTVVAAHLGLFVTKWCYYMKDVAESDEKDSAYLGLCQAVFVQPDGLMSSEEQLTSFIDCVSSYIDPSEELIGVTRQVLEGYKAMLGGKNGEWEGVVDNVGEDAQMAIRNRYGL